MAKNELREAFCKPRARCFKGYAILCGIYTLANLLFAGLIPPIVKQHGDTTTQHAGEATTPEEIQNRLNILTTSCLSLALTFAFLSVINLCLFVRFTKVEASRKQAKNAFDVEIDNSDMTPNDAGQRLLPTTTERLDGTLRD